jgi:hypothetical protein
MSRHPSVESVLLSGTVTDLQTLELRRQLFSDSTISEREADWLFEINDRCVKQEPSWGVFFVEALTDFFVHQLKPAGYISDENARWLIECIDSDGKLESKNELELLLAIFEKAKSVPEALSAYALDQVKHAVTAGEGVTRSGAVLEPGIVSENDVEVLRRILYAYGSPGNIAITDSEAEVLFDINDQTAGAANHPSWNVLFAQALANHMMMTSGHTPISRETALRYEAFLYDEPKAEMSEAGFIESLVKSLRGIYNAGVDDSENKARDKRLRHESDTAASEIITAEEAKWLASRIDRDGTMSEAEKALLSFIKRESPDIHPSLKPLLDKVA